MRRYFATLAVILSVPFLGYAALAATLVTAKWFQSVSWGHWWETMGQVEPIRWVIAASALVIGLLLLVMGRALQKSAKQADERANPS
jgi:hypothetical protein